RANLHAMRFERSEPDPVMYGFDPPALVRVPLHGGDITAYPAGQGFEFGRCEEIQEVAAADLDGDGYDELYAAVHAIQGTDQPVAVLRVRHGHVHTERRSIELGRRSRLWVAAE